MLYDQLLLKNRKIFLPTSIFFFFFLTYLITGGGHTDVYDGIVSFLIAENLSLNSSPSLNFETNSQSSYDLGFDLESYITMKSRIVSQEKFNRWSLGSENYSIYDYWKDTRASEKYLDDNENFFGPSYLVLPILSSPIYSISSSLGLNPINFVPLLVNSIIISFTCIVIFFIGKELFTSEKIGFILSLIFGLTTFIWPYISSMYSRPIATLFLLLAIYFFLRYKRTNSSTMPIFAGLAIGLSFLSHLFFLFLFPGLLIFGIYAFHKNHKNLIVFISVVFILVLVLLYTNYARFGDPTLFGLASNIEEASLYFEYKDYKRSLEGVYGLLFSPGQSIFLYFPISILFPFSMYYMYKKNRSLTILFLYLVSVIFFHLATNPTWYLRPDWGSHRYLIPIIPIITISVGSLLIQFQTSKKFKLILVSLGCLGFFVNLLGNLVWIMYSYSYGWGPESLWKIKDSAAVFTWNPLYSPILQSLKILSSNWVGTLEINPDILNYFKIGLTGCSYDLYIYCKYGIIPIFIIVFILIFISFFIIKILVTPKNIEN